MVLMCFAHLPFSERKWSMCLKLKSMLHLQYVRMLQKKHFRTIALAWRFQPKRKNVKIRKWFENLALAVIDEQHKFGVRQRAVLKQAGLDPHYLVMTATPIPRTVAMTLFGDLDISTIRQGPHQQSIHTYCEPEEKSEQWWDFYRKKLRFLHGRKNCPWKEYFKSIKFSFQEKNK